MDDLVHSPRPVTLVWEGPRGEKPLGRRAFLYCRCFGVPSNVNKHRQGACGIIFKSYQGIHVRGRRMVNYWEADGPETDGEILVGRGCDQ